jgi:hypothetical protein
MVRMPTPKYKHSQEVREYMREEKRKQRSGQRTEKRRDEEDQSYSFLV